MPFVARCARTPSSAFQLPPRDLPRGVTQFVDDVVPILQSRGLLRANEGHTLRDRFGLSRPANRYAGRSVPS